MEESEDITVDNEAEANGIKETWELEFPNWEVTITNNDDGTFTVRRDPPV